MNWLCYEYTKHIFAYKRDLEGKSLTVLLNFSERRRRARYEGQILVSSYGGKSWDGILKPYEAVILQE